MNAHLRGETPYYESEHRLRTKSGEWVWVLNRGKVVSRDAQGRPLRATGTQFDVSDRKRSEEERAALLEMAKELSGTLDLEELVAAVERRTAQVLPADMVATIYWDTDREAYRLISQHGLTADLAARGAAPDVSPRHRVRRAPGRGRDAGGRPAGRLGRAGTGGDGALSASAPWRRRRW